MPRPPLQRHTRRPGSRSPVLSHHHLLSKYQQPLRPHRIQRRKAVRRTNCAVSLSLSYVGADDSITTVHLNFFYPY